MGDVINLNLVRKQRERDNAKAVADVNVVKHGRSKSAKMKDKAVQKLETRRIESARLTPSSQGEPEPA